MCENINKDLEKLKDTGNILYSDINVSKCRNMLTRFN